MITYHYSWNQFDADCINLLNQIKEKKFKSIAGVAFGGLPLLTYLKNKLDLPTRIIFAKSYENNQRKELTIKLKDLDKLISPVLIVDDIIDSGNTLSTIKNYLIKKQIKHEIATLFYSGESIIKPDYYLRISKDWVKFPWE